MPRAITPFSDLPDGSYTVKVAGSSWTPIRSDWTPTTGSPQPARQVQVSGATTFDWGWRRIVRSTDPAAPVSTYTGPNGLEVRSYDDVVTAKSLYDDLAQGGLVGEEAADVTVRFDLTSTATTTASVGGDNGVYTSFHATVNLDYLTWLDSRDNVLFHEYGHAWSLYYAYMKQQDATMSGYLQARGLAGDSRVNSTYSWNVKEMIAEDYRELFGSTSAQSGSQMNGEIPKAADVPGLADYLSTAFRTHRRRRPPSRRRVPAPSPEVTSLSVSSNSKSSYLVAFTLATNSSVSVEIRDSKGQLVKSLLSNKPENAGAVAQGWNRTDSQGRTVRRGTYTARVLATASGPVGAEVGCLQGLLATDVDGAGPSGPAPSTLCSVSAYELTADWWGWRSGRPCGCPSRVHPARRC